MHIIIGMASFPSIAVLMPAIDDIINSIPHKLFLSLEVGEEKNVRETKKPKSMNSEHKHVSHRCSIQINSYQT